MTTTYKKVGLICAAAATAAVLSAMPISIERSATTTSGIVLSVNQAKAYYGHYRRVTRRVVRRHVRRCAYGVTCSRAKALPAVKTIEKAATGLG